MDWKIPLLLFWAALSFAVAFSAKRRGFSFWAYLLHSFLPSPVVALITLGLAEHGPPRAPVDRCEDDTIENSGARRQASARYGN